MLNSTVPVVFMALASRPPSSVAVFITSPTPPEARRPTSRWISSSWRPTRRAAARRRRISGALRFQALPGGGCYVVHIFLGEKPRINQHIFMDDVVVVVVVHFLMVSVDIVKGMEDLLNWLGDGLNQGCHWSLCQCFMKFKMSASILYFSRLAIVLKTLFFLPSRSYLRNLKLKCTFLKLKLIKLAILKLIHQQDQQDQKFDELSCWHFFRVLQHVRPWASQGSRCPCSSWRLRAVAWRLSLDGLGQCRVKFFRQVMWPFGNQAWIDGKWHILFYGKIIYRNMMKYGWFSSFLCLFTRW